MFNSIRFNIMFDVNSSILSFKNKLGIQYHIFFETIVSTRANLTKNLSKLL